MLELAEKYCAVAAGLWVEREIMKKATNGRLYDTYRWQRLTQERQGQGQWTRDVLSLDIFAERLDLGDLVEVAAKLTLTLMSDVMKKIPDDLDRFFGRKEHTSHSPNGIPYKMGKGTESNPERSSLYMSRRSI